MDLSRSTLIMTALGLTTAIALSAALITGVVYSVQSGSLHSLNETMAIIG